MRRGRTLEAFGLNTGQVVKWSEPDGKVRQEVGAAVFRDLALDSA